MNKKIYTIAPELPFARHFAAWMLEHFYDANYGLSRAVVFLPSRRACQSVQQAFLDCTDGKPLLLPRLQPLGGLDEEILMQASSSLMPEIPVNNFTMRRLFTLTRLIQEYRKSTTPHVDRYDYLLELAIALSQLLDELEREEVSLDALLNIVPSEFAKHWQITVDFLQILSLHWKNIFADEDLLSPIQSQQTMLKLLTEQWTQFSPDYPVIAAGSTGSIPSTANFMKLIMGLPEGHIVLPGVDVGMDETSRRFMKENHPQWGMYRLLANLSVKPEDVTIIGASVAQSARGFLVKEIMRPAQGSNVWNDEFHSVKDALVGLQYTVCKNAQEEATVIALMLREVLETPQKTAALVTHDRMLAARVIAAMQRFGVQLDDSAGQTLLSTPLAQAMRLLLEVVLNPQATVPMLALLKHPLVEMSLGRRECLEATRQYEVLVARKRPTFNRKNDILPDSVLALIDRLQLLLAPLVELYNKPSEHVALSKIVQCHLKCAESILGESSWQLAEAELLQATLLEMQTIDTPIGINAYLPIFESLIGQKTIRAKYGMHPRLKILSPIEARLQSFDRMILGGLNEGSWPPKAESDPWFNQAMRNTLGLQTAEHRIGLSAHDFSILASSPEVFITRSLKVDGVPTTPARWFEKLLIFLNKYPEQIDFIETRWNDWAAQLDVSESTDSISVPYPKPPVSARPKKLSVTQVEKWLKNPYSIYASVILGLRPLSALDRVPDASDFGNAVHATLELFVDRFQQTLPDNALDKLLECGRAIFPKLSHHANVQALWWPRFEQIAQWVVEQEAIRRNLIDHLRKEVDGSMMLGDFMLTGRADRVEIYKDGRVGIVDYKTGAIPKGKDIESGKSSQLLLLGLMAGSLYGKNTPDAPELLLEYWQLKGGREVGVIEPIADAKTLMEAASAGLETLIDTYKDAETGYMPRISSQQQYVGDYDHLARVKEWN